MVQVLINNELIEMDDEIESEYQSALIAVKQAEDELEKTYTLPGAPGSAWAIADDKYRKALIQLVNCRNRSYYYYKSVSKKLNSDTRKKED